MNEKRDAIESILFNYEHLETEQHYEVMFEEYKLYVDIMDKTSSRRDASNNFFLTLNSAIITISTILYGFSICPTYLANIWLIVVGIIGIIVSISWLQTIKSYKKLNEGRFKIINLLEKKLPAQIFNAEWVYLKQGQEGTKSEYKELTETEIIIPWSFIVIYSLIILIGFLILIDFNINNYM